MRLVPVSYLREGTEIAIDVINEDGRILFKKGQKVTQGGIACLDRLGVSYVYITDEHCYNDKEVRYGSDFNTIYRSILKLRRIAYRVAEGTSDKTDIIAGLTVARTIVEYIVAMDDDVKITYEPSKMVVNSVIERAIYVAMMSTVLGHKMKLSKDRLVKLCLSGLLKDLALVSPKIKSASGFSLTNIS